MVSITVPLEKAFRERLEKFSWVNWSEIGRENLLKRDIFDRFIKTGTVSSEDQEFCDNSGWDPIDELEVKQEYIERLKKLEKEPQGKPMTVDEFNNWCDSI